MGTPKITTTKTATGTDTAVQVTETAGAEETIFITFIAASISAGNSKLTVSDGATEIFRVEITTSSPFEVSFPHPIALTKGNDLSVDLTAAGAGNDESITVSFFKHDIS